MGSFQMVGQGECRDKNDQYYPYMQVMGSPSHENCADYCRQIGPEQCVGYLFYFKGSTCELYIPSCAGQDKMFTIASTDGGYKGYLRSCEWAPTGPVAKSIIDNEVNKFC